MSMPLSEETRGLFSVTLLLFLLAQFSTIQHKLKMSAASVCPPVCGNVAVFVPVGSWDRGG